MIRYFLIVTLLLIWAGTIPAQTFLTGQITDGESGKIMDFVQIEIRSGETLVAGEISDEKGEYRIPLDPGSYTVIASMIGYANVELNDVVVYKDQSNVLDIVFQESGYNLPDIVVTYEEPIIRPDKIEVGLSIPAKDLVRLPGRDLTGIISSAPRVRSLDEGEPINIGGARSSGTVYYIDDIRVNGAGSLIPISEIEELKVITSGISPQYGDVTGGVVSITTKGMSNEWKGGLETETSQFLDPYGQHLINAYFSGPLLKNKKGNSILGLRFGAQWNRKKDDTPTVVDIPYLTDEAYERFSENPIVRNGSTLEPAVGFITEDDISFEKFQPNETYERLDISGKLTARLSPFIDISLGGSFVHQNDQFTPNSTQATGTNWRLLNSRNNPYELTKRYRTNLKFRHRLGSSWSQNSEDKVKTGITYLQYNFIGGFEKSFQQRMDPRHKDNLFAYGHVGKFEFDRVPSFSEDGLQHVDYTDQFTGFQAGVHNPLLANYNNLSTADNFSTYLAVNGEVRGGSENVWGLHTNLNQVYDLYRIRDNDRINFSTNFSFDYRPNKNSGIHSIKFGVQYEQQINRGYQINPSALWTTARQSLNGHISGLDTTIIIDSVLNDGNWVDLHPALFTLQDQAYFYTNVRALTGQDLGEFVYLDEIPVEQLSLDMFAPRELNNPGDDLNLSYWGYDFTGKKLDRKVQFSDFFTERDENDIRTFPVAPWEPNYTGFYLQDKFSFKDLFISLGLRVDRYDANTQVLKDPYSLYEVMTATDFYAQEGEEIPSGVQGNYRVYTAGPSSDQVVGFREGDRWYNPQGVPVNSGAQIFGGEVVHAKLYEGNVNNIRSRDFDPSVSFEDYRPDWNILPRIAFSFPISKVANFFAHYDILSQRPEAFGLNVSRVSALDYYNFEITQPLPNANLKSQQSIEYEVGFQQALGKNSSIQMIAFYKELRNLIQRRTYLFLPPPITSYETYGNIDFGTIKGFSFEYKTRRIGNIQFNASYTLMFADGTGSDADGQRGITSRGNIRTLYPLDYDERHQIQGSLDFRFGYGKKYNGPRIAGVAIFENAGINIQSSNISGRPFTAKATPTVLSGNSTIGQINGSRLPWQSVVHLKVNKFIAFKDKEKGTGVNIYCRIQNLFDKRNAKEVYPSSGSPSEDAYLQSPDGQDGLLPLENQPERLDGYLNAYQWRLINPNFFTQGRRIYAGATFQF